MGHNVDLSHTRINGDAAKGFFERLTREICALPVVDILAGIRQIAAGSFANLPRFRLLGNAAPLARAVDGDGTSRRHAER
jgi:hypothetical protein